MAGKTYGVAWNAIQASCPANSINVGCVYNVQGHKWHFTHVSAPSRVCGTPIFIRFPAILNSRNTFPVLKYVLQMVSSSLHLLLKPAGQSLAPPPFSHQQAWIMYAELQWEGSTLSDLHNSLPSFPEGFAPSPYCPQSPSWKRMPLVLHLFAWIHRGRGLPHVYSYCEAQREWERTFCHIGSLMGNCAQARKSCQYWHYSQDWCITQSP